MKDPNAQGAANVAGPLETPPSVTVVPAPDVSAIIDSVNDTVEGVLAQDGPPAHDAEPGIVEEQ